MPDSSQSKKPVVKRRIGLDVRRPAVPAQELEKVPRPSWLGTILFLIGLLVCATTDNHETSVGIARHAAVGVGVSLLLSLICDAQSGLANMIRADVMALFSLYFLTLFEFISPQADFESMVLPVMARQGVEAVYWGFAGLAIGRHLLNIRNPHFSDVFVRPVSERFMLGIFWFCLAVGYFHMLLAVNFNPIAMISYFMEPRFSQPWGRGKFGDWKALLNELGMLIYLIPPIAGVMIAQRHVYSKRALTIVISGCLFTFFYGFSSGTRNIFASFLVTFLIGYAFATRNQRNKEVLIVTGLTAILLMVSTLLMLEFREVGFRNYLEGNTEPTQQKEKTLFVDYNLYVICQLIQVFPERHDFLGWEVPYLAIIRPIPRAVWPGKPEGLSLGIEDALGAEDLTLASSFIGESYMSAGLWGVFIAGCLFGMLAGWWGHIASPRNSDFGILIYASGFFAVVISMRSLFVFTTAILPTLSAIILGSILIQKVTSQGDHPAHE